MDIDAKNILKGIYKDRSMDEAIKEWARITNRARKDAKEKAIDDIKDIITHLNNKYGHYSYKKWIELEKELEKK